MPSNFIGGKNYIPHNYLHNKNFDHSQWGKQIENNTTPDASNTEEIKEMRKDGKEVKPGSQRSW